MTAPLPPLEYASPRPADSSDRGHIGLAAALALAVGFLGANAFADAAGFPVPRDANRDSGYVALRVLCGFVVFAVAWVVLSVAFRELHALARGLAASPTRPALPVAMACLICGTTCVIAALLVQLYGLRHPAVAVGPGFGASVRTPLMAHIVTLAAFLLGVALIAVGIWSSMGRTAGTQDK